MTLEKKCEMCDKFFEKKWHDSKSYWERKRFCSISCSGKDPKRVESVRQARLKLFAEGKLQTWNKGKKGLQVAWNKGNGAYAKKLGFGKWMKGRKGVIANNWKGEDVGYGALHDWVRRELGTPNKCTYCGLVSNKPRMLNWANLSRQYKRDLNDWIRLCVKCHKEFDKGVKQRKYKR